VLNNIEQIHSEDMQPNTSHFSDNQEVSKLMEDYNKVKKKEEATKITLIESQKKWTNFSMELLNISFDLLGYIETHNDQDKDYIANINKRLQKYDLFLKQNAEELDKNTSHVQQDLDVSEKINQSKVNISKNKSPNQSIDAENIGNRSIHIDYDPNNQLEFTEIKSDLAKINSFGHDTPEFYAQVNLILRELRLRLSRRRYSKLKQVALNALIYYDLFSFKSKHIKIYSTLLHNPQ
jgi:hypothetical protein